MTDNTITPEQQAELDEFIAQTVNRVESLETRSLAFALISNTFAQSIPTLDSGWPSSEQLDVIKIPELPIGVVLEKEWFLSIGIGTKYEATGHWTLSPSCIGLRYDNSGYHLKIELPRLFQEKWPGALVGSFLEKKRFLYLLNWGLDALEGYLRETIEKFLPNGVKLSDLEKALSDLGKNEFSNPEQETRNKVTTLRKAVLKAVGDLDESRKISSSPVFGEIKKSLLKSLDETA